MKEALIAGKPVEKIIISSGSRIPRELFLLIKNSEIPVQRVPKSKLDSLFPQKKHQGVGAFIGVVKETPFFKIVEKCVRNKSFIVILDRVEDPGNVGNIIRSALSFGAEGVILGKRRSVPLGESVVKASSGSLFHVPVSKVTNLRQAVRYFKESGGTVVSLETGGEDMNEVSFTFPLCIILGSEGKGISRILIKESDIVVKIPMEEGIGSLNVASAAAIAFFQIFMQRRGV